MNTTKGLQDYVLDDIVRYVQSQGYIVRKSKAGLYTKNGSLKHFREKHDGDKVVFSCFKSRLRNAGMLSNRRSQGNLDWALERKDTKDRKQDIRDKINSL